MIRRQRWLVVAFLLVAPLLVVSEESPERFWAQWRGSEMTGLALHGNPPIEWSEDKNVRWKVEIPGLGSSTPVILEDRLFVVSAVPSEGEAVPPPAPGQDRRRRGPPGQRPSPARRRGGGGGRRAPAAPQPEQQFMVFAMDHGFDASPAVVEGKMYLRGYHYLYRISEDE